jgi:hypothetical protein
MRHWIGLVLAVALAAALFFGAAWGMTRLAALPAHGGSMTSIRGLTSLGAMAGVGLLLGVLIAAPRISPLATGLPGLVLLAWTALYALSTTRAVRLIPLRKEPSGAGFHILLSSGVAALLGFAMVVPMFVPSRWRRSRGAGHDGEDRGFPDSDEDGGGRQRRRGDRHPPAPPGLLAP